MTAKRKSGPPAVEPVRDAVTSERILSTALWMIEHEGVDSFSMRKLAAKLGVSTPTVYWHVGNRDELFNQLIKEITDQLGSVDPKGDTPAQRIASISTFLLGEVRARPQLVALSATQGRGEAIFTKVQTSLVREIEASGLQGEQAAFALATILFHLGGFMLLEHGLSHDYRIRGAEQWSQQGDELSSTLKNGVDFDRVFEFTLEAILGELLPYRGKPGSS